MAHRHDKERFRPIPHQKDNYPGKSAPHIAHGYGTLDGFPQHVTPSGTGDGHWPPGWGSTSVPNEPEVKEAAEAEAEDD
jgi:hypothetical protein